MKMVNKAYYIGLIAYVLAKIVLNSMNRRLYVFSILNASFWASQVEDIFEPRFSAYS